MKECAKRWTKWSPAIAKSWCYGIWNNAANLMDLRIADAATGFSIFITSAGSDPQRSPDGATIAFWSSGQQGSGSFAIETIRPDGTNRTVIVQDQSSRKKTQIPTAPTWSPDSQHVAYRWEVFQTSGWSNSTGDVYRATSTGGDTTNLTNDTDAFAHPVAWRQ